MVLECGEREMASRGAAGAATGVSQLTQASRMRTKLQTALEASVLEIEDVLHQHAGHAAMREKANGNGETHFNLKVVSPKFEGQSLVKRHSMVYDALADELQSGLHALSIVAKTPQDIVLNPIIGFEIPPNENSFVVNSVANC